MINKKRKFILILNTLIGILTALLIATGCSYDSSSQNTSDTISDTTSYSDEELRVHYIDVGQADSILIQTSDNKNMLIDAGETKDDAILNYLDKMNVNHLDKVIATHPHADHISEMASVIKKYDIDEFYMPKITHTSKTFEKMVDALSEKNITPIAAKAGMSFDFGNTNCEILAPSNDKYDDLNNYSVVIRLTYGENSFLFTGDAEELSENEILNTGSDLKSDVLKVGHHGSSSSTSQNFLDAVNPSYAVISCAEDNEYGHPHKETIAKLQGIDTYITKDFGTVVITSDSKNINVYTADEADKLNTSQSSQNNQDNQNTQEAQNNNESDNKSDDKESKAAEVNGSFIGNANTKKYHSENCSVLPNEENRVYFNSKEEAENQGFSPHSNCVN